MKSVVATLVLVAAMVSPAAANQPPEPTWCDGFNVVGSVTATVLEIFEPVPTCHAAELASGDCVEVTQHQACDRSSVLVDGAPHRGPVGEIIGTHAVRIQLCEVSPGPHEVQVCFHPDAPASACAVEQPAEGGVGVSVSRAGSYQVRVHVEEVRRGPSTLEDTDLVVELRNTCPESDCPVFDARLPSGRIHLEWRREEAGVPRAELCVMRPEVPPPAAATGCQRCAGGGVPDPGAVVVLLAAGCLLTPSTRGRTRRRWRRPSAVGPRSGT